MKRIFLFALLIPLFIACNKEEEDVEQSVVKIGTVETIKHRGFVWGYDIEYTLIDPQGHIWKPFEDEKGH